MSWGLHRLHAIRISESVLAPGQEPHSQSRQALEGRFLECTPRNTPDGARLPRVAFCTRRAPLCADGRAEGLESVFPRPRRGVGPEPRTPGGDQGRPAAGLALVADPRRQSSFDRQATVETVGKRLRLEVVDHGQVAQSPLVSLPLDPTGFRHAAESSAARKAPGATRGKGQGGPRLEPAGVGVNCPAGATPGPGRGLRGASRGARGRVRPPALAVAWSEAGDSRVRPAPLPRQGRRQN